MGHVRGHKVGIADDLALQHRIGEWRRRKLLEIGTDNGLRKAESKLLPVGDQPGGRGRRKQIFISERRDDWRRIRIEQRKGGDILCPVLHAHAAGKSERIGEGHVKVAEEGFYIERSRVGIGVARDLQKRGAVRPDVVRRENLFQRLLAALIESQVRNVLEGEAPDEGLPVLLETAIAAAQFAGKQPVCYRERHDQVAAEIHGAVIEIRETAYVGVGTARKYEAGLFVRIESIATRIGRIQVGSRFGIVPLDTRAVQNGKDMPPLGLVGDQLPFLPLELVDLDDAVLVQVETDLAGGFILGLAQHHRGQVQLVQIGPVDAAGQKPAEPDGASRALDGETVVGPERTVTQRNEGVALLCPGPPGVVPEDGARNSGAELVTEPDALAALDGDAAVRADFLAVDIVDVGERFPQRLELFFGDAVGVEEVGDPWQLRSVGGRVGDRPRQRPGAVVEAAEIAVSAVVGEPLFECSPFTITGRYFNREKVFLGDSTGTDFNGAAAEITRHIRRVTLLHEDRTDYTGREQVKRHHLAGRVGAGDVGTVEQRGRITLAETPDEDELAVDQRQARHARQGTAGITVAGARNLLGAQYVGDTRGLALFVDHRRQAALDERFDDDELGQFQPGRRQFEVALGGFVRGNSHAVDGARREFGVQHRYRVLADRHFGLEPPVLVGAQLDRRTGNEDPGLGDRRAVFGRNHASRQHAAALFGIRLGGCPGHAHVGLRFAVGAFDTDPGPALGAGQRDDDLNDFAGP